MEYQGTKLYFMSGTHWDREWYQTFQGFRYRLVKMMDHLIDYLENNPDFGVFTWDGQTIALEDYIEIRPENRERLENLIAAGKIIIGPWFCMPDELLVSGESLIRNLQVGHEVSQEYGGQAMKFGYICDAFGHTAQMPQIFAGFGIPYALLGRGTRKGETPANFRWRAPDGSECITHRIEGNGTYRYVKVHASKVLDAATEEEKDAALKEMVQYQLDRVDQPVALMTDGADHAPLSTFLPEFCDRIRRLFPGIEVLIGRLDDMGRDLEPYRDSMKVLTGELIRPQRDIDDEMELLTNVLSSRYDLKQQNDRCQTLMEKWVQPIVLFSDFQGNELIQRYVDVAYRWLISNHAHDSICGCSIDEVHQDMKYRFAQTEQIAGELVWDYLYTNRLKAQGEGPERILTVHNPLPYARREVIDVEMMFTGPYPRYRELFGYGDDIASFRLIDTQGQDIPYTIKKIRRGMRQWIHEGVFEVGDVHYLSFEADLPGGGFAQYRVVSHDRPTRHLQKMSISPTAAENEWVRLTVEPDGTLTINDKRTGKTYDGLLSFIDDGEIGDGWFHVSPVENRMVSSRGAASTVAIVADGPSECTFSITSVMRVPCAIERFEYTMSHIRRSEKWVEMRVTSYVTLTIDSPVIRVRTEVENNALDHRLRLCLPTGIAGGQYFANEAFCFVERDCGGYDDSGDWRENAGEEKAMSGVVGKRDAEGCGLAFVSAAGLHECAAADTPDGMLRVTLLRAFDTTRGTNGQPDAELQGTLEYTYALVPLSAEETNSKLQRIQDCLATGVRSTFSLAKAEQAPCRQSFLELKGDLCFSTAKRPLDGQKRCAVVRVYNPFDQTVDGSLHLFTDIVRADYVDLMEERLCDAPFSGHTVSITLAPWKMATLRIFY